MLLSNLPTSAKAELPKPDIYRRILRQRKIR